MCSLSRPEFHNEQFAYDHVEARIWPHGVTCPKCGEREQVSKMGGKSTRIGTYECHACRKPFTVSTQRRKSGIFMDVHSIPPNGVEAS